MKNLLKSALVIMMISIAPVLQATDLVHPTTSARSASPTAAESKVMMDRLEEIKGMDITKMSSKEKRALRKEVRATEKAMHSNGGVYISVGGLLLIILLIILLV